MPRNMMTGSMNFPRLAAAMTPPATPTMSQITAAPKTSESVTGAAARIWGTTLSPMFT